MGDATSWRRDDCAARADGNVFVGARLKLFGVVGDELLELVEGDAARGLVLVRVLGLVGVLQQ